MTTLRRVQKYLDIFSNLVLRTAYTYTQCRTVPIKKCASLLRRNLNLVLIHSLNRFREELGELEKCETKIIRIPGIN
jgi:hypothetical protein